MSSGERSRRPGFYWLRIKGNQVRRVGEWYIGMGNGQWCIPRCLRWLGDDQVMVLSDRLLPPKKVAGKKKGK